MTNIQYCLEALDKESPGFVDMTFIQYAVFIVAHNFEGHTDTPRDEKIQLIRKVLHFIADHPDQVEMPY